MVQENGTELSEKASFYKGVFYNYLSIGISLVTFLFVKGFLFYQLKGLKGFICWDNNAQIRILQKFEASAVDRLPV
jgi:hypothetical protein